ncbi:MULTISPECIES: TadE/TadG family type IV pilus assembly protein [Streptomyces]|uniref:Pilus assembly protein n=2 Tax=Streptomyces TaxID=1883 RepID=A0A3M8F3B9_9ACTN|nr:MULTISPECIES: TadE/TadG family type IV pilus assembly protein [Streptomyces]KNE82420.1 pilus assembly protein TadE [Streptomyces fradiae]OFA52488.1 pilus assembly protein TadE [Streptomyces fradiae]PQM19683.1 pilus assembly protein TadE [Streptomyces xinghaiensis]RKM91022.1 pilus assembly protein [Streptomyces xinghaiensis]RNC72346.1 pilus assembly protein [Streptomyces xinghaiensis]
MTALRPSPGGDRGAASTQLVLVVPALLLLALLAVQFALAWHARHIAQYAAQRALAAARVEDGSAADGRTQARRSLTALGSRVLTAPSVTVDRTTARTTVRVDGSVLAVVPGLDLRASGTASGPTERITVPTGDRS